ncbi:MAG TPA: flagellar export chaperone FliS [Nocardioides sp.]
MNTNPYARNAQIAAYQTASVATASPARLLVMLYERLVADVQRALDAQQDGRLEEAHHQLVHAQEIVIELWSTLDTSVWDGAAGLGSIYSFLHNQLIMANTRKDPEITSYCLSMVTDLCTTWREAAMQASVSAASA